MSSPSPATPDRSINQADISDFSQAILDGKVEVKIGDNGGRYYKIGGIEGEHSLKSIAHQLNEYKLTNNDEIKSIVQTLNAMSTSALKGTTGFKFALTLLKSFFGNLGLSAEIKALKGDYFTSQEESNSVEMAFIKGKPIQSTNQFTQVFNKIENGGSVVVKMEKAKLQENTFSTDASRLGALRTEIRNGVQSLKTTENKTPVEVAIVKPKESSKWKKEEISMKKIEFDTSQAAFGADSASSDQGFIAIFGDPTVGGTASKFANEEQKMTESPEAFGAAKLMEKTPMRPGKNSKDVGNHSSGIAIKGVHQDVDISLSKKMDLSKLELSEKATNYLKKNGIQKEAPMMFYGDNPSHLMRALAMTEHPNNPNYGESSDLSKADNKKYAQQVYQLANDQGVITNLNKPAEKTFVYFIAPKPPVNSNVTAEQVQDMMVCVENTLKAVQMVDGSKEDRPEGKKSIPVGWLGCGAFNNNPLMVCLAERAVAAYMDEDIIFHDVGLGAKGKEIIEKADNFLNKMPTITTKEQLVNWIVDCCKDEKNLPPSKD